MEPIEMAALGRALYPGMLYDCRRDSFIPGVTLWDKVSLTEGLDKRRQSNTDLKFSASDSFSDKASLLNVSATLKGSFLGGLVEVGGSAKYLNDQKSSARQSRVTLQFSQTTRFEQLTMTQLGKITYPQVFEEKIATHVITAVLYGAQVFMVFDKTASENENRQEVDGKLDIMVKKIPLLSIEGEGALQMNDSEKKLAESISCTFYGDCVLEENPTTYMEALQLYKKLPSLLRQREDDAVPVRVWLYPLACLDNRAAKLEGEISATLISEVESVLEDLGDVERTYNDLVKHKHVNDFQEVRERLQVFQESFSDYKVLFQKALCRLLPAIRGGEKKQEALANILLIHSKSPFTKIKTWLENVQSELNLLNSYICELSAFPIDIITSSVQFDRIRFDLNVDTVVCFTFTSLKDEDPFLSSISKFVKVNEFEKCTAVPESCYQDTQAWFNNPEMYKRMKENIFLFRSFAEANKDQEKTRFLVASISDSSNPGTSIHLYKQGELVNSKFQPVSKPPKPSVDVQDRNLVLKLQKSPTGETVWFRVEHRITQPDDSGPDAEDWEVTDTPDAQETFTLTERQLANQCWVRYRAVSDVGVSGASDSVCISLQGKGIVTVDLSWDGTTLSLCNALRNKILTSLGSSWWSLSTIQSEVTNRRTNISVPYVGAIPGELKPGMALYFQGNVPPHITEFTIKCKTGPQECDDVAMEFCFSYRFFCDISESNGNQWWLSSGSAFDIFIVIKSEKCELFVNDKSRLYNYHVPKETISTLQICGDVVMITIGIIPNWSTSTFGKELNSKTSRCKHSIIQSGVEYPVCSPSKPYTGPITGGLRAGLILFFQGGVPSDSNGFAINLKCGPKDDDDVAFQFKARFGKDSAVCNSFSGGKWESPEEIDWNPFFRGRVFDMFMVVNPDVYEVIVNGDVFCKFKHRIALEKVSTLNIEGDVFMNTFGISEMDSVNMKVTIPAHV